MSLHIITHAYAMKLPQYEVFLRAQLSSLTAYTPEQKVKITVCYSPEDKRISRVLDDFYLILTDILHTHPMEINDLCRRSIGRSQVGRKCNEDLIWFADCDYFWEAGCLDRLMEIWSSLKEPKPSLVWPLTVKQHRTQEEGDELVKLMQEERPYLIVPDTSPFESKRCNMAIGGVQVVDSKYVREHGYVDYYEKAHRPVDIAGGERVFNTREDSRFRKHVTRTGGAQGIQLDGVCRLRHTQVTYRD